MDAYHVGSMEGFLHPTDGWFVECSFEHAQQVNALHPLRLVRVLSSDRAEFEPAMPFGTFRPLSPPPYKVTT